MKKILAATCLLGISCSALADDFVGAGLMHIQIANDTNVVCKIVGSPQPAHGIIEKSPPYSIMPGDSKTFDVAQTFFGPVLEISYNCGGKTVTLSQSQPLVIFLGKWPVAEVKRSDGLVVDVSTFSGYVLYNRPGQVNWVINNP